MSYFDNLDMNFKKYKKILKIDFFIDVFSTFRLMVIQISCNFIIV
jgi:hypothetical protein